ncbi:MAG: ABC transporter permease [Candidatus Marinimicrobia bacterium]|nr:ABC transporter permease [Candidatus Neomarinimicrobiota bacterium]
MKFPFFIALRHIFSKHKLSYTSFLSILSVIGLSIGVCALLLTMGILDGFERELVKKVVGFDAHIRIRTMYQFTLANPEKVDSMLETMPEVRYIIPYVHAGAMIKHENKLEGVIVEGIDPDDISKSVSVLDYINEGGFEKEINGKPCILLGMKLAEKLGVNIGNKVLLIYRSKDAGIFSKMKIKEFVVGGIYESGMSDYDDVFVYVPLKSAQSLFNLGDKLSGYQLILVDPMKAKKISREINNELGFPYIALSWMDLHQNLIRWLEVQRLPIMMVFSLILAVALFNLSSSLTMIITEKKRDIGILRSFGLNSRQLISIFGIEGLIIGLLGFGIGCILTIILAFIQNRYGIVQIPQEVYFMSKLPIHLSVENFVIGGFITIVLSLIFTIYPTKKSTKLSPADCVRYE